MLPDVRPIGESLAWSRDLHEAAVELGVDEQALKVRLQYLHPAGRGWLKERLEEAG